MTKESVPPEALRELRDRALAYVYEHGAGKAYWGVKRDTVKTALSINEFDFRAVENVLRNEGLLADGSLDSICLNQAGQQEAKRQGKQRTDQLTRAALHYMHEYGADQPKGLVPIDDLKREIGVRPTEWKSLYLVLHNAGWARTDGRNSNIALTPKGRQEIEGNNEPTGITIHAPQSIFQYAGSHSTQNAHLTIDQSEVMNILNQIERELPQLSLTDADRQKATGILSTLRRAVTEKLPEAGAKVLAEALAGILTGAASSLGQRLIEIFQRIG